jgi:hypothetical protein
MYCQNKLCRETVTKTSYNGADPTDLVCPSCGFKTLKMFDMEGIRQLMEKDVNELTDMEYFTRNMWRGLKPYLRDAVMRHK